MVVSFWYTYLHTSLKFDGAKITDIKEICDSILEEEKGSR